MGANLSRIVWPIVVIVGIALAAVTVVLLYASAQAAVIMGLVSAVILPTLTQLIALSSQSVQHDTTIQAVTKAKDDLVNKITSST